MTGFDAAELRDDAKTVSRGPHAPAENRFDAQKLANLLDALRCTLQLKHRIACGHAQLADCCEGIDELFGHAVTEIVELLVGIEILKRKHGNRVDRNGWLHRTSRTCAPRRRSLFPGGSQILLECPGTGMTAVRIVTDRTLDHANELGRKIGPRVPEPDPLTRIETVLQLLHSSRLNGIGVRDEMVEQYAEAVDIAARTGRRTLKNLRRKIHRRPD